MDVGTAVRQVYDAIDPAAALADVSRLCGYDRFQSSTGIGQAAGYVAERAAAAGLADVRVLRFAADGREQWWTYRSPPPWTPVRATLALADGRCRPLHTVVSFPSQPYALAAFSAATPRGGLVAPLVRQSDRSDLTGAIVLLDGSGRPPASGVAAAAAAGAAAVVAAAGGGGAGGAEVADAGWVGRIELPPGARCAAFSVTADQLRTLGDWARIGGRVRVEVTLDGAADLPVVTGWIPGTGEGELLLTAHLCHPRPSANDNASGVAALLALAGALQPPAGTAHRLGIRFLWAPEFVGLAAYLHDVVETGAAASQVAAVNVDMAGEDQQRCRGPLVVERSPDDLPSYLNPVLERCVAALPQAAVSYSGAVGCDTWAWRATPFVGASDHLLLVEPPVRAPAASLGHWPDRFNHSSADTLDKVDPAELRRTAAVAGAAAATIRGAADGDGLALLDTVTGWAAGELLGCLPGNGPASVHSGWSAGEVLAAGTAARAAALARHRAVVATGSVRAVAGLVPAAAAPVAAAARWLDEVADQVWRRLADRMAAADPDPDPDGGGRSGPALARGWPGPFNLRALARAAEPDDRDWLDRLLAGDRGGGYARIVAVARAVDGMRDREAALRWATLSSGLPIRRDVGQRAIDMMIRAGWLHEPGELLANPGPAARRPVAVRQGGED